MTGVGVFAILELIKEYKPYILFTTDEEKGGLGAKKFSEEYQFELWNEIKYIIEIDRRGNNQAVFYNCGNQDFKNYVLSFDFKECYGTFSDISVLSPVFDIASVNLSAGYYNEHTLQEHININHLCNTINKVKLMLSDDKQEAFFDYQEKISYFNKYNTKKDESEKNNKEEKKEVKKEDKKEDKKEETKEEKKEEAADKKNSKDDDDYYCKLYQDWWHLSDIEFRYKYGQERPKCIDDLWGI